MLLGSQEDIEIVILAEDKHDRKTDRLSDFTEMDIDKLIYG